MEHQASIDAATRCLDDFMMAFNSRDVEAWDRTFNFPSIRLASNTLAIIEAGYHKPDMFKQGALEDWDHSAWERREVSQPSGSQGDPRDQGPQLRHLEYDRRLQACGLQRRRSFQGKHPTMYCHTVLTAAWPE